MTQGWRKLHNEEPHNLYSSPNIIKVIKSTAIGCKGHVARMGNRNSYRLLVRNLEAWMSVRDRLCGLVIRVLGYRSGGPVSIPGTTKKKSSGSGTGSTQPSEYN
jgi:hypothetical protein